MNDPADVYKNIAIILSTAIPEPWVSAKTHVELSDHSSKHVTYYKSTEGKEAQVFIDDDIDPIVCKLQEDMATTRIDKAKWYTFEFTLDQSGKFSVDFGYDKPQWVREAEELEKK